MNLTGEQRKKLIGALSSSGLFITCGKEKPNIMSTHWGALGSFWNKQVFILPIRTGKLSHEIIDKTKSFAISVPKTDMSREIMLCDSMSGYSVNKFETLHLHPKRARKIPTYVLSECGLILECKVIYVASAGSGDYVDEKLRADYYDNKEFHSVYFGEISDCYEM